MGNIIDIRSDDKTFNLKQLVLEGLIQHQGKRRVPTLILYDDLGLQLFDLVTYKEDYYVPKAEIDILERKSEELVQNFIKDNSILIELGSGALRKTKLILDAIERNQLKVQYYALDLMEKELVNSLQALPKYKFIECFGLHGTYDDGIEYMKYLDKTKNKVIMWFGTSVGNFNREEAIQYLTRIKESLNVGDKLLVGIDLRNDEAKVYKAYDNSHGVANQWVMNGLTNLNSIMKQEVMVKDKFEFASKFYVIDGYLESQYRCLESYTASYYDDETEKSYKIAFSKDELIHLALSYKYNNQELNDLTYQVQVNWLQQMLDSTQSYSLNVFLKPPFYYTKPTTVIPTILEWDELWKSWDYVCYYMIPKDILSVKFVELPYPLIFYLGYLLAFIESQLKKYYPTLPLIEPKSYISLFIEGTDSSASENSQSNDSWCNPAVSWPTVEDIQTYQKKICCKLDKVIKAEANNTKIGRLLTYLFEYQCIHLETIICMLIQSEHVHQLNHTIPLPQLNQVQVPVLKAKLVKSEVTEVDLDINHIMDEGNPLQLNDDVVYSVDWDTEPKKRTVKLNPFEFHNRPVTNFEYLQFLKVTGNRSFPIQWEPINLENFVFKVKTICGSFNLDLVGNWPVSVSYNQASAYCTFYKMRLPTEMELKAMEIVVTSININAYEATAAPNPDTIKLQINRSINYNTGLRNWVPLPVDNHQTYICGDAWEWTSTQVTTNSNFNSSKIYRGYSENDSDTKWYVLKGGSYLTHPRLLTSSFRIRDQVASKYALTTFRPVQSIN